MYMDRDRKLLRTQIKKNRENGERECRGDYWYTSYRPNWNKHLLGKKKTDYLTA